MNSNAAKSQAPDWRTRDSEHPLIVVKDRNGRKLLEATLQQLIVQTLYSGLCRCGHEEPLSVAIAGVYVAPIELPKDGGEV